MKNSDNSSKKVILEMFETFDGYSPQITWVRIYPNGQWQIERSDTKIDGVLSENDLRKLISQIQRWSFGAQTGPLVNGWKEPYFGGCTDPIFLRALRFGKLEFHSETGGFDTPEQVEARPTRKQGDFIQKAKVFLAGLIPKLQESFPPSMTPVQPVMKERAVNPDHPWLKPVDPAPAMKLYATIIRSFADTEPSVDDMLRLLDSSARESEDPQQVPGYFTFGGIVSLRARRPELGVVYIRLAREGRTTGELMIMPAVKAVLYEDFLKSLGLRTGNEQSRPLDNGTLGHVYIFRSEKGNEIELTLDDDQTSGLLQWLLIKKK